MKARRVLLMLLLGAPAIAAEQPAESPGRVSAAVPVAAIATEQWPERLAGSSDPRLLLVGGLIASRRAPVLDPFAFWREALRLAPDQPVVLYSMASHCLARPARPDCTAEEPLAALARADPENAAVWLMRARHALQQRRHEVALRHLQRAAAAGRFDTYWREYLAAYAAAQAALLGEAETAASWSRAIGLIATLPDISLRLHRECRDGIDPALDHAWRVACVRLGRLISEAPLDTLNWALGLAMERAALKALGEDSRELARHAERQADYERFKKEIAIFHHIPGDEPRCWHEASLIRFMRDWLALGEVEALRRRLAAQSHGEPQMGPEACTGSAS